MNENYKLKFTVLAENHEACDLECEHGLSIFVEYEYKENYDVKCDLEEHAELEGFRGNSKGQSNTKHYLLDAGQSGVFVRNAEKLGIDLAEVDAAFLSHAHYDHADGFAEFFRVNSRAVVYAREEGRMQDCYSVKRCDTEASGSCMGKTKNGTTASTGGIPDDVMVRAEEAYTARYIGISTDILEGYPERFSWVGARSTVEDSGHYDQEGSRMRVDTSVYLEHGEVQKKNEVSLSARESGRNSGKYKNIAPGIWLIPHDTPDLEKIGERTGMYREAHVDSVDNMGCEREVLLKTSDGRCAPESNLTKNQSRVLNPEDLKVLVPDDFSHEQSLVLESGRGLLVFNSCSHGGVANTVAEVRQALPGKHIYAYIGGFHLKAPGVQDAMNCTEQEVEELGRSLMELGIEKIYTGHCTGERGFQVLKGVLGEKLELLRTGLQVEI